MQTISNERAQETRGGARRERERVDTHTHTHTQNDNVIEVTMNEKEMNRCSKTHQSHINTEQEVLHL